MEAARRYICIYHEILIGLGQELNRHLPLQCSSEFTARKFNLSAIMCVRMVPFVFLFVAILANFPPRVSGRT